MAKTGEPVIVPDVRRDSRYVQAREETRSELAAPLLLEGRTIGVFNLESNLEDAYHEGHLDLLSAFAAQAAVAIERARLTRELLERRHLEKELTIARDIQLSFLPKSNPILPGFEIAGTSRPHDQVGGDYYDFIRVSESRLGIAIADVAGKGIPAALLMAGFRMSLLAEIRNEFAIRAVMRKVNSLVYESTDRHVFVTAFYGLLDSRNRGAHVLERGAQPAHPSPRRRHDHSAGRRRGRARRAARRAVRGPADRHSAGRRPRVLTDGISRPSRRQGEQFGTSRIEQRIAELAGRSAQEILDGIISTVLQWCGTRGPNDDLTVVVLKSLPDPAA